MERFYLGFLAWTRFLRVMTYLIDTLMAPLHWNSKAELPHASDAMTYDCYVLLRHLLFQYLHLCPTTKQGVLRDYMSIYKLPVYSMNNTNSSASISHLIKDRHVTLFESNK